MFIFISIISGILAGMGVGGGAIFVLLSTRFSSLSQKEAQVLNLILFIFVGISATIENLKNKNIDFKIFKKTLPLLLTGSIIGTQIFFNVDESSLKKYFNIFLLVVGIYEIITSLIKLKKANNIRNKVGKE